MRREKLTALLLAVLLLVSAGCSSSGLKDRETDKESQTTDDGAGKREDGDSFGGDSAGVPAEADQDQPPETGGDEEALDPEMVDRAKYNIYVEMNNKIVDVLDTLYSYYEVVEYAEEFALLPDSQYTYKYNISPYNTDLLDDAQYVASLEPAYETLDELTLQILLPMRSLMDAFSDIYHDYDYAADQYAKPKEYHKAIQGSAAVFEELAYQYMDAVEALSMERVEADEQQMRDDGRLLAYGFSHSITVVKKIINECYSQEVNDYNLLELDLEPIRPLYQELLDTITAYKTAAEDSNQLMAESMTADGAYHYGTQMDRMAEALEWMIGQVEDQYLASEPGHTYLGCLLFVNEVLSDCIDQYNSSSFVS